MTRSNSTDSQTSNHLLAALVFGCLGLSLMMAATLLALAALVMAGWSTLEEFFSDPSRLVILAAIAALVGVTLVASAIALKQGIGPEGREERGQGADGQGVKSIYDAVDWYAHLVKAVLQMAIGVVAVAIVAWKFVDDPPPMHADSGEVNAISLLLDGIGVGLAAAAVVELAYTLFTKGPDEALDPLLLGVSAALLIQLGGLDLKMSLDKAAALLALGLLLAVLFATRLMLAERHDYRTPKLWWINRS